MSLLEDTYIHEIIDQDDQFHHHFHGVENSSGYQFWQRLKIKKIKHVFVTPIQYLPDLKLIHDPKTINTLINHINDPKIKFDDIADLYDKKPVPEPTYFEDLTDTPIDQIREIVESGEILGWRSFWNDDMQSRLEIIYSDTVKFCQKYGIPCV